MSHPGLRHNYYDSMKLINSWAHICKQHGASRSLVLCQICWVGGGTLQLQTRMQPSSSIFPYGVASAPFVRHTPTLLTARLDQHDAFCHWHHCTASGAIDTTTTTIEACAGGSRVPSPSISRKVVLRGANQFALPLPG